MGFFSGIRKVAAGAAFAIRALPGAGKIPLSFGLFAICLSSMDAWAIDLNFRGLNAASTRADVLSAFPNASQRNDCRNGESARGSAEGTTACEELASPRYPLDGIEFDVSFIFGTEGKLRYVALSKQWGHPRLHDSPISKAELNSIFTSLSQLITSKYGAAVDSPTAFLAREGDNKLEWQPGGGGKWRAAGDSIKLSASAVAETAPGLYWASLQLFYTFARRSEFERF